MGSRRVFVRPVRGSRHGRRLGAPLLVAVILLGGSGLTLPPADAALPGVACTRFAVSADYVRDGKLFCVSYDFTGDNPLFKFFRSSDRGRSWQQRGEMLAVTNPDIGSPLPSPNWLEDHQLFLHMRDGLYVSTDEMASFTQIDPQADQGSATAVMAASPIPNILPGRPERRAMVVLANGNSDALIDPPFHLPVQGSPGFDMRFFVSPDYETDGLAYVLGSETVGTGQSASEQDSLFRCDANWICNEKLFSFPPGYSTRRPLGHFWLSPGFPGDNTMFAVVTPQGATPGDYLALRSTDGGKTFSEWPSLNELLAKVREFSFHNQFGVGLAGDPSAPKRLFLRISYYDADDDAAHVPPAPPAHQIFMSNNLGDTWKRTSFGLGRLQSSTGARGSIPWTGDFINASFEQADIFVTPDGRLFATGDGPPGGFDGLYCSVDKGKTWAPLCKK